MRVGAQGHDLKEAVKEKKKENKYLLLVRKTQKKYKQYDVKKIENKKTI